MTCTAYLYATPIHTSLHSLCSCAHILLSILHMESAMDPSLTLRPTCCWHLPADICMRRCGWLMVALHALPVGRTLCVFSHLLLALAMIRPACLPACLHGRGARGAGLKTDWASLDMADERQSLLRLPLRKGLTLQPCYFMLPVCALLCLVGG